MHLILEITPHSIAAYQLIGEQLQLIEHALCSKKTDLGYKEVLTQVIEKAGDLNRFEHFSCSYFGQEFCLVPNALFAASSPDKLLQFTVHNPVSKSDVEYNRLPEWSSVIVYQLPMWVKSVLIMKAPRIVIQHELAHILRHLTNGSLVPLRSHLVLHEDQFSLVVRKDGAIAHASIQEFQNEEDIVYHLATVFNQLHIDGKNELYIHGSSNKAQEVQRALAQQLKRMNLFQHTKLEIQETAHLQYQKLCV